MGLDVSAKLVVGISLSELFLRTWDKESSYEEHNAKGEKTGNVITEKYLWAELPTGEFVMIGEYERRYNNRLKLDLYNSLGFDGESHEDYSVELHYGDYDTNDLSQVIIGKEVAGTDSHRDLGNKLVIRINDVDEIDVVMDEVYDELKEIYNYDGNVNQYLINSVGY